MLCNFEDYSNQQHSAKLDDFSLSLNRFYQNTTFITKANSSLNISLQNYFFHFIFIQI